MASLIYSCFWIPYTILARMLFIYLLIFFFFVFVHSLLQKVRLPVSPAPFTPNVEILPVLEEEALPKARSSVVRLGHCPLEEREFSPAWPSTVYRKLAPVQGLEKISIS